MKLKYKGKLGKGQVLLLHGKRMNPKDGSAVEVTEDIGYKIMAEYPNDFDIVSDSKKQISESPRDKMMRSGKNK